MKWKFVVFCALIGSCAPKGTQYGQGVTGGAITPIATVLADAQKYVGKTVVVEGKVDEVCKMKGCWMDLSADQSKIRIKVNDDEIVFPQDAKGKTARAEGVVEAMELTKDDAVKYFAHLAEEQGTAFDSSTVTGPMTIYRVKGKGAVIF